MSRSSVQLTVGAGSPVTLFVQHEGLRLEVEKVHPVVTEAERYGGPYDVTPKVEAQTLATRQKYMLEDVSVKSIPYYETSNLAGGETVYIGTEVI